MEEGGAGEAAFHSSAWDPAQGEVQSSVGEVHPSVEVDHSLEGVDHSLKGVDHILAEAVLAAWVDLEAGPSEDHQAWVHLWAGRVGHEVGTQRCLALMGQQKGARLVGHLPRQY